MAGPLETVSPISVVNAFLSLHTPARPLRSARRGGVIQSREKGADQVPNIQVRDPAFERREYSILVGTRSRSRCVFGSVAKKQGRRRGDVQFADGGRLERARRSGVETYVCNVRPSEVGRLSRLLV